MLYRTLTALSISAILLSASLTMVGCGDDDTSLGPTDYPVTLRPVSADNQTAAQVYIPKGDGWLEISSSQSTVWDDPAFDVKWTPEEVPLGFRLLSENTWEYSGQAGGPFEYLRVNNKWTFMTNDTALTYHAVGTPSSLRFYLAVFLYVHSPARTSKLVGYKPGDPILLDNAVKTADTIAYVTWDLVFEPESE